MKLLSFRACILFLLMACNNTNTDLNTTSVTDTLISEMDSNATDNSVNENNLTKNNPVETGSIPLIIAGESVGKVVLGMDASNLENTLGKPDMSDAAMGKAWITWYGKKPDEHNNKTVLNIYTTYKDTSMREKTVQQIRTTSSFFSTQDSIHVYSSLADIKNKYAVKKAAQYNSDGRVVNIYDDKRDGIAFEIAAANEQNICMGIIIHQKNKSVNDVYIMLHTGMQRFDK